MQIQSASSGHRTPTRTPDSPHTPTPALCLVLGQSSHSAAFPFAILSHSCGPHSQGKTFASYFPKAFGWKFLLCHPSQSQIMGDPPLPFQGQPLLPYPGPYPLPRLVQGLNTSADTLSFIFRLHLFFGSFLQNKTRLKYFPPYNTTPSSHQGINKTT